MGGPKTHRTAKPAAAPTPSAGDKRKFKPRPAAPVAERLPKLYRALTDQVDDGFFDNAKKTCKKILALDSGSTAALQTLIFLYLQTDDYAAALDLVTSPPSSSPPPLDFERAYCLYRLHREKEALSVLEKIGDSGPRELYLKAQLRYRLGEYASAQEIYDGLLSSTSNDSPDYEDICTNRKATEVHLDFINRQHVTPAPTVESAGLKPYTVAPGELETFIPIIPTGWAPRGKAVPETPVASSSQPKPRTKPRHRLPKGAAPDKPFKEDPDRWLPLRQRASYAPAQVSKKKEQTGLGTQGSVGGGGSGGGGGGGGGGGKKKKKGKK